MQLARLPTILEGCLIMMMFFAVCRNTLRNEMMIYRTSMMVFGGL